MEIFKQNKHNSCSSPVLKNIAGQAQGPYD